MGEGLLSGVRGTDDRVVGTERREVIPRIAWDERVCAQAVGSPADRPLLVAAKLPEGNELRGMMAAGEEQQIFRRFAAQSFEPAKVQRPQAAGVVVLIRLVVFAGFTDVVVGVVSSVLEQRLGERRVADLDSVQRAAGIRLACDGNVWQPV